MVIGVTKLDKFFTSRLILDAAVAWCRQQ